MQSSKAISRLRSLPPKLAHGCSHSSWVLGSITHVLTEIMTPNQYHKLKLPLSVLRHLCRLRPTATGRAVRWSLREPPTKLKAHAPPSGESMEPPTHTPMNREGGTKELNRCPQNQMDSRIGTICHLLSSPRHGI